MKNIFPYFFLFFFYSFLAHSQGLRIIVIPYTEEDLCAAFDQMTIKQREAIDEVSSGFQKNGFKSASFTAIMRKIKGKGGCDTHNPQKMLASVLASSQSTYYVTAETGFESMADGNFVSLNLSVYDTQSSDLVGYASAQSDKFYTNNTRTMTGNAFDKIVDELKSLMQGTAISSQNFVKNSKKIQVNLISDIDTDLPASALKNPDAIAVVIGNANYERTKSVAYALNDAAAMKKYLIEVMGYKEGNIFYLEDARKSDFELLFGIKDNPRGKLFNTIKKDKSDIFIFYSGHGAPGLKDKEAYFVPVDCEPQYVELGGYPSETFYRNIAQIPAKSITVVLDACFSGAGLFENISPIVIKAKGIMGVKEGVLLASSANDQVSCWYNEKGHGMFTYFFLKAIHSQNADLNQDKKLDFMEIFSYISDSTEGLPYYARSLHGLEQNPVIQGLKTDKVLIVYK